MSIDKDKSVAKINFLLVLQICAFSKKESQRRPKNYFHIYSLIIILLLGKHYCFYDRLVYPARGSVPWWPVMRGSTVFQLSTSNEKGFVTGEKFI
jgi:hypothetical protein